MKSLFKKIGLIDADPKGTVSEKLGSGLFDTALLVATLGASAPAMAAKEGTNALSIMVREFGNWIKNNPGMFATTSITGTTGAVVGEEIGGNYKFDARFLFRQRFHRR